MENGSRALIMAATVLLGVFLLSMMVYMFSAGGRVTKQYDDRQINQQLEAYNGQFEVYDSTDNTITDIVSLANLVYSTNEENEFANGASIQLDIDIAGVIYSIPGEYKKADAIKPDEKKYLTKRNTILFGTEKKVVSIYDVLNCPVNCLKTLQDNLEQQITLDVYGAVPQNTITIDKNNIETLSQSKLIDNNRRIYKYIFVCESGDEFSYYEETGRVKYIKLKLYINPDYPL